MLQQDYVLDNMGSLLDCVRMCNISFRWRVLQSTTQDKKLSKIINTGVAPQTTITLLLNMSQLEFILKDMVEQVCILGTSAGSFSVR